MRAAEVLSEGGHCKMALGDTGSREGAHCAVGALHVAQKELGLTFEDLSMAARAVDAGLGDGWNSIVTFNNHPRTTGEDVILLFKRVANGE